MPLVVRHQSGEAGAASFVERRLGEGVAKFVDEAGAVLVVEDVDVLRPRLCLQAPPDFGERPFERDQLIVGGGRLLDRSHRLPRRLPGCRPDGGDLSCRHMPLVARHQSGEAGAVSFVERRNGERVTQVADEERAALVVEDVDVLCFRLCLQAPPAFGEHPFELY